MKIKLCKDCKWTDKKGYALWCKHKKSGFVDYSTGEKFYSTCALFRRGCWLDARLFGWCGEAGRFWEKEN